MPGWPAARGSHVGASGTAVAQVAPVRSVVQFCVRMAILRFMTSAEIIDTG